MISSSGALVGEEPREVLEASGIVRRAHLLQVKGPLRLSSDALNIYDTGDAFIGLPRLSVQQASLVHAVDYVITVENPTSFGRYSVEVEGNYLALLTDGFPARDVLSSMVHFVPHALLLAPDTQVYPWGDIDAGGLMIAAPRGCFRNSYSAASDECGTRLGLWVAAAVAEGARKAINAFGRNRSTGALAPQRSCRDGGAGRVRPHGAKFCGQRSCDVMSGIGYRSSRATNAQLRPVKSSDATSKSLIVLNP